MQNTGSISIGFEPAGSDPMDVYRSEFYRALPEARNWEAFEVDELIAKSNKLNIPANNLLLTPQSYCESFIILLGGTIRVYQVGKEDREITLYRVNPGDFCVLSLNSLLKNQKFNATACAESPVRALSMDKREFINLTLRHKSFLLRVMESLTGHFSKILSQMEDLAFSRLEYRLACVLRNLHEANGRKVIKVTHLELARELGATREVVSRILKNLEKQGYIKLARGKISLIEARFSSLYENA